jgi:hypothetical protein
MVVQFCILYDAVIPSGAAVQEERGACPEQAKRAEGISLSHLPNPLPVSTIKVRPHSGRSQKT